MGRVLREYQVEAIKAVQSALVNGVTKQLVSLPTGMGKTVIFLEVIKPFTRKMICVDREELIEQAGISYLSELTNNVDLRLEVEKHGGLISYLTFVKKEGLFLDPEFFFLKKVGIIKADVFDVDADIVLASIQTLHRRLNRIPKDYFDAIVIDEAHLSCSATARKIINHFQPKLLYGTTATPHRADGGNLGDIYDDIVYQYPMLKAFEEGYLCELDAIQIRTDLSLDHVKTTGGEFNQRDLRQEVDVLARNKLIFDSYKKYADGLLNLIFCVDIEHARNVCEVFIENGELAEVFVSDAEITPDRKVTLSRFKSGKIKHLITVGMATTGLDVPQIGCIIMARPTKSLTLFTQMIGRGTRPLPGVIDGLNNFEARRNAIAHSSKDRCIVLDICDTSSRHKLVNTWTLDANRPVSERLFTTKEKKDKIIAFREAKTFEANKKQDARVSLLPLPKVHLSDSIRMKEPATDKQLEFLKGLGYDIVNFTYSKGDANRMISEAPASASQVAVLKRCGYDTSNGVTIAEARLAFEKIEKERNKLKGDKSFSSRNFSSLFSSSENYSISNKDIPVNVSNNDTDLNISTSFKEDKQLSLEDNDKLKLASNESNNGSSLELGNVKENEFNGSEKSRNVIDENNGTLISPVEKSLKKLISNAVKWISPKK